MGYLNTDCPNCLSEDAHHDGLGYVCSDCGHTWGALSEKDFDDDFNEDSEED
jgi:uncharacterized Zn ribbon protein